MALMRVRLQQLKQRLARQLADGIARQMIDDHQRARNEHAIEARAQLRLAIALAVMPGATTAAAGRASSCGTNTTASSTPGTASICRVSSCSEAAFAGDLDHVRGTAAQEELGGCASFDQVGQRQRAPTSCGARYSAAFASTVMVPPLKVRQHSDLRGAPMRHHAGLGAAVDFHDWHLPHVPRRGARVRARAARWPIPRGPATVVRWPRPPAPSGARAWSPARAVPASTPMRARTSAGKEGQLSCTAQPAVSAPSSEASRPYMCCGGTVETRLRPGPPSTSAVASRELWNRLPQDFGCGCGSPVEPEVNAMATMRSAGSCQSGNAALCGPATCLRFVARSSRHRARDDPDMRGAGRTASSSDLPDGSRVTCSRRQAATQPSRK